MLSTTELLVEHIISGILSLIWVLAFVFTVTGLDTSIFPVVKEYWALFAIVITAIAYPIGIMVDTFADKILDGLDRKIKKKHHLTDQFSMMKLINKMNDDNVRSYFTYNRFKTRVARSSMVNFGMIGMSMLLLLLTRGHEFGVNQEFKIGSTIFLAFSIFSVISFFLWKEVANTTYRRAGSLYHDLNDNN